MLLYICAFVVFVQFILFTFLGGECSHTVNCEEQNNWLGSPEQCDAVVEGRYKWSSIIYQPRALSPLTHWARRQYPDTSDLNAEKRPLYHKNSPRSYKPSSLLSSRSLHHFYHPSPLLYIITAIILYWKWEWTLLHIGQIVF